MADTLFMATADVSAFVGYLGTAYALGLGVGMVTFCAGYGLWFIIDLLRGGI